MLHVDQRHDRGRLLWLRNHYFGVHFAWNRWEYLFLFFTTRCKLAKISPHHLLISCLALTDLIVCIGFTLMRLFRLEFSQGSVTINKDKWLSGEFTCKYLRALPIHIAPAISAWTLVGLSFECYWKISHPFGVQLKRKIIIMLVSFIWISTYCVALPVTLTSSYLPNKKHCFDKKSNIVVEVYHSSIQSLYVSWMYRAFCSCFYHEQQTQEIHSETEHCHK